MRSGCGALRYSKTVRPGEELSEDRLRGYLSGKLPGVEQDLRIQQFPGGHSNLTYLVATAAGRWVLRRPPFGAVAPKAHDMTREYSVLAAVHPRFREAPRVVHLCSDTDVIGAVFYLMEFRPGIVVRGELPNRLDPTRISESMVDCLARLHAIGIEGNELSSLGRPEGFVERQVRGWAERWRRSQTGPSPEMDRVIAWLEAGIPAQGDAALVHNDFKLDNVVLREDDPGRIEAVLDWEMSTVGDPLADLGLALCYWAWAKEPAVPAHPGWYSREQFIERYAAKTGRDVSGIGYYEVLGVFKLAVIVQQIYFRFSRGQTRDERFRDFGERARALAGMAASMAEHLA